MTTAPSPAGMPVVRVLPDPDALWRAAAEEIARVLARALADRGVAHWSTTGGSAAPGIYEVLRVPPLRETVDWSRVQIWWGDDRFVPEDHPLSNVLPLTQILLASGADEAVSGATSADVGGRGDGIVIPVANLHPIPMSDGIAEGGAARSAARYAAALRADGPLVDDAGTPMFDLLLLGVGPDGHILSVFPGSAAWDASELCLAIPAPTHVEPHVERVTLHPRIVAAARRILVVSAGASKAAVLGRAWTGDDARELPVRATRTTTATWLLDEAAAAELPVR
jgi:6-phosphogluconolactonase